MQMTASLHKTSLPVQIVQHRSKWLHAQHRSLVRPQRSCCIVCRAAAVSLGFGNAATLEEWAQTQRFDKSKQSVEIAAEGGQLLLRCSRDSGANEALLTVPDQLWINASTVAKSSIGDLVESLAPWLQVALFLISERAVGSGSRWHGYIQSLPESPASPLFWSPADRQLLECTQLLQSLEGYEEYFEETYAELSAGLFSQHSGAFSPDVFTSDAFKWAATIVRSHSHAPLEGAQLTLVPFADLVQHSRTPTAELKLEGGLLGGGRSLKLTARRALAAGRPVTLDFGADGQIDSQVVLDYGAYDSENPQGGFLLALGLSEDDRNFDDKADILEINGFQETWQFALRAGQPPEAGLLAFLRLVNLGGADAFLLESIFRNEAWDFMLQPVSQENEAAVCQSMADGCREALAAYPTSIDQDLDLLRDDSRFPAGSPAEIAVRVRLGEKQGLDTALSFFEDRAQRLETLEYYQERRLKNLGLLDDSGDSTYDGFFKDGIA